MDIPETRYAPTPDGGLITYKSIGDGPSDLAYIGGLAMQIEVMWEYEPYARFLLDLASSARLIVHDRRGTGLSDAGTGLPDLETRDSLLFVACRRPSRPNPRRDSPDVHVDQREPQMLTGVMLALDTTLAPCLRAPDVEQPVEEPHPAGGTQMRDL